jgi:hypothetical protein
VIGFPVISRLFGIDTNTVADNTGPIILVRQDANGNVITNTNAGVVSVTPGGDMDANGATINLLAPGLAKVVLGATPITMEFINMPAITLMGGPAAAAIVADGGSHIFIAGKGALTVTGGAGADNYIYHMGSGLMTIQDFSVAKGDILTVDKALQGSMRQISDNQGGTMLRFGSADVGIDLKGVDALPSTGINWI